MRRVGFSSRTTIHCFRKIRAPPRARDAGCDRTVTPHTRAYTHGARTHANETDGTLPPQSSRRKNNNNNNNRNLQSKLVDNFVVSDVSNFLKVSEAQRQALSAVEAVLQGLSPDQQLELRNQLDQVLSCVASLRAEVAELRGGLLDMAQQMIPDPK